MGTIVTQQCWPTATEWLNENVTCDGSHAPYLVQLFISKSSGLPLYEVHVHDKHKAIEFALIFGTN